MSRPSGHLSRGQVTTWQESLGLLNSMCPAQGSIP